MSIRLSRFEVNKLFGQYDNSIEVRLEDRITAVIGPNGRGKTICLRMINAFYKRSYWFFDTIDFSSAEFVFTNGLIILIEKIGQGQDLFAEEPNTSKQLPVRFSLIKNGQDMGSWQPKTKVMFRQANNIARYVPWLSRIAPNHWRDDRTSERLTTEAVIERYADFLPSELISQSSGDEPEFLQEVLQGVECRLIETQRLLSFPGDDSRQTVTVYPDGVRKTEPFLVVQQKARTLKSLLSKQLAEYANLSQRLDRSYPRRVIESRGKRQPTLDEVTDRLSLLDSQRKSLEKAGILDADFEPLPSRFGPDVAELLMVYIEDTESKLNVFSNLRAKIDLFTSIINNRFIDKNINIDKNEGFRVKSESNNKEIPLEKLSSGEQHQLILTFELLFEMQQNSLILIDEPELSLHVSWQKKFIGDLRSIIELNGLDVILATHSPQLIGRWSELAVELASVEE